MWETVLSAVPSQYPSLRILSHVTELNFFEILTF